MKRSRFSEEQIIGILKEQEAGNYQLCLEHKFLDSAFHSPDWLVSDHSNSIHLHQMRS